ncbi:MAG: hypothetical protein E7556_01315 [Ruminococcaceae bacterium]|nr:hypothetical protein [Oscillospiraceae bacterium]
MLKKTVVLKRRKMNLPKFDYRNFFFISLFICGLILGVLTIKSEDTELNNVLKSFFVNYISVKSESTILECFLETSILIFVIPVFSFILGLCAVGGPIIIAIPTVVGIIVGMATGILYSQYALQGLGYSALIIMPSAALVIGTLLKCCSESINMSLEIIYLILGGSKGTTKTNELKEYCLRYLVLCVPFLLSAVLNTVCFKLFGGLFSFV